MARALLILGGASFLSACATYNPQVELQARAAGYVGQPITTLIETFGTAPTAAYRTSEGATFLFERSHAWHSLGGGYIPDLEGESRCNIVARTVRDGASGTLRDFRIFAIDARGAC